MSNMRLAIDVINRVVMYTESWVVNALSSFRRYYPVAWNGNRLTRRMIHALGYSHDEFKATSPGRLCRGRERWIEPWELESAHAIHRLVITGAAFTDDSARDAVRGINHSTSRLPTPSTRCSPKKPFMPSWKMDILRTFQRM